MRSLWVSPHPGWGALPLLLEIRICHAPGLIGPESLLCPFDDCWATPPLQNQPIVVSEPHCLLVLIEAEGVPCRFELLPACDIGGCQL